MGMAVQCTKGGGLDDERQVAGGEKRRGGAGSGGGLGRGGEGVAVGGRERDSWGYSHAGGGG